MDQNTAKSCLQASIRIFQSRPFHKDSWKTFWKSRLAHHPLKISSEEFINEQTNLLSEALNTLGKDDALIKKFVTTLPLRLSKTILEFPTTPQMIKELMTD